MNVRALDAWGARGGVLACRAHAMPAAGELVDGRAKPGHDGREGGALRGAATGRRWEALWLLCASGPLWFSFRPAGKGLTTEAQRRRGGGANLRALQAWGATGEVLARRAYAMPAAGELVDGRAKPGPDGREWGALQGAAAGRRWEALRLLCASGPLWFSFRPAGKGLTTEAQRHREGGANLRALQAWGATGGVLACPAHAMPAAGELVDGRAKPTAVRLSFCGQGAWH